MSNDGERSDMSTVDIGEGKWNKAINYLNMNKIEVDLPRMSKFNIRKRIEKYELLKPLINLRLLGKEK